MHWSQTHPIYGTASHKNLNVTHIYGLPLSKACQFWTATEYFIFSLILLFLTSETKVTPSPTVLRWPEANSLRSWAQQSAYHCSVVGAEQWRTTASGNVKMHHTCKKKENKTQTCIFWSWKQTRRLHVKKPDATYSYSWNFPLQIQFWSRHEMINPALSFLKVFSTLQQCMYLHNQKGSFCMSS